MRNKFLKLSGISFGLSFFVLVFNYFFYHYFGESGFTTEFSKLPRKPFVSDLI